MTFTARLFLMVAALVAIVCSLAVAQTLGQPERFIANAVSLEPAIRDRSADRRDCGRSLVTTSDRERLVMALQQGPTNC
jgi:hypothetical protein